MSAKMLTVRKIREVLRLKWSLGLSHRAVARSCGIGHTVVAEYVKRAERAGLGWPLPAEMDSGQLERLLFPPPVQIPSSERPLPDWTKLHQELKRKGVTLSLLWEEYKAENPNGFLYSRFCELYGEWASKLDVVMRQEHRAGAKLFLDYTGQTIRVVNNATGVAREGAPSIIASARSLCGLHSYPRLNGYRRQVAEARSASSLI